MEDDALKEDGVSGANALEGSKDRGASKRQDHFGARDGPGILHLNFVRTPTCRLSSWPGNQTEYCFTMDPLYPQNAKRCWFLTSYPWSWTTKQTRDYWSILDLVLWNWELKLKMGWMMEIGIESIFSGTEKKLEWWLISAARLRLWSLKMVLPPSSMILLVR